MTIIMKMYHKIRIEIATINQVIFLPVNNFTSDLKEDIYETF